MIDARISELRGSYDQAVDVLHLAVGAPTDVEGDEIEGGVELDYDAMDGHPCGVTVMGYERNGWPNRLPLLADIVAKHLSIRRTALSRAITEIVNQ